MSRVEKYFKIKNGLQFDDGSYLTTAAGSTGYTGSAGIGYTGSAGTGYTGSAGTAGGTGYTGSAGTNGTTGYTGSAGTNGTNGYTGSAGGTGFTGSTGFAGSAGSPGAVKLASGQLSTATTSTIVLVTDYGNKPAFYSSTTSNWLYIFNNTAVPIPAGGPPVTSGLIGQYDTTSFSGSTWSDLSGSGNNATATGTITKATGGTHGNSLTFDVLSGGSGDYILFPAGVILPSTYTLFHIGRNPGSGGWTFGIGPSSNSITWLSGYFSSITGVAYHEGWVGLAGTPDQFGNDFFISTDQNSYYRANRVAGTVGTSGSGVAPTQMSINYTTGGNWVVAEVLVYNRTLTGGEITQVEDYLAAKYGITL